MDYVEITDCMSATFQGIEQCVPQIGKGKFPFLLVARSFNGKAPLGQISKTLHISLARCSNLAKRLEEEGLIRRIDDPSDKRICYIEVTEKGEEFYESSRKKWMEFIDDYRNYLGEENFGKLREVLCLTRKFLQHRQEKGEANA